MRAGYHRPVFMSRLQETSDVNRLTPTRTVTATRLITVTTTYETELTQDRVSRTHTAPEPNNTAFRGQRSREPRFACGRDTLRLWCGFPCFSRDL